MNLWPFRHMPVYGDRCPECGQNKMRGPHGNYCAYVMCAVGKHNHDAALSKDK